MAAVSQCAKQHSYTIFSDSFPVYREIFVSLGFQVQPGTTGQAFADKKLIKEISLTEKCHKFVLKEYISCMFDMNSGYINNH